MKNKIKFGIMSSKWEMECEDLINGKMAMILFLRSDIPIAIYEPKEEAFFPRDFLESKPQINNLKVKKALKTIKIIEETIKELKTKC